MANFDTMYCRLCMSDSATLSTALRSRIGTDAYMIHSMNQASWTIHTQRRLRASRTKLHSNPDNHFTSNLTGVSAPLTPRGGKLSKAHVINPTAPGCSPPRPPNIHMHERRLEQAVIEQFECILRFVSGLSRSTGQEAEKAVTVAWVEA